MSLALAAKHLAARGRGNDSMLVHMSPKEVSALQGVALAHGGSLSVNPDTGLPEASFLESVLPTVLGAGLMMIPGLNIGALGAAGIVGGAQYARTGDIGKGLMAGLGAYGGAGLASGLSSAGAKTAGDAALAQQGSSTLPGVAKPEMLMSPAPIQAAAPTSALPSATPELMSKAAPQTIPGLKEQMLMSPVEPTVGTGFPGMTPKPDFLMSPAVPPVSEAAKMSAGLGQITQSPAALGNFALQNKYPLMAAATSIASKEGAFDAPKPPKEEEYIRPYEFSAGFTGGQAPASSPAGGLPYTSERQWFAPTYTPMPIERLAGGGLVALAEGGESKGQMSGQSKEAFDYLMGRLPAAPVAPPPPRPAAPESPAQNAAPGVVGGYRYDPVTQTYTAPPPPERRFGSFMGGIGAHLRRQGNYRRPIVGRLGFNEGGSTGLEKGGFVVPADVVSDLGNGSSSAGLELLAKRLGAKPIKGPGDGMSDSIRTSIEGKQKAAIARDEAYVPREKVKQVGGAKRLYDMMDKVRSKAHGKKSQQRKLSNPSKLVP